MKKSKTKIRRRTHQKCPVQKKAMFDTEKEAGYAMKRAWSHDPSVNILDMHTYVCDVCKKWHFGHISKYKTYLERHQYPAMVDTLRR